MSRIQLTHFICEFTARSRLEPVQNSQGMCQICKWVMPHMQTSHITYKRVQMTHIWMSYVTHRIDSHMISNVTHTIDIPLSHILLSMSFLCESSVCITLLSWNTIDDYSLLQGGDDPYDAVSWKGFFRKRGLYLVALLRKATCNLRHPMHLRHPVLHDSCEILSHYSILSCGSWISHDVIVMAYGLLWVRFHIRVCIYECASTCVSTFGLHTDMMW